MPKESQPNLDVNWQIVNDDFDTEKRPEKGDIKHPDGDEGVDRPDTDDSIPLPDDQRPAYPVEEPPGESNKPPLGDVDDSPKRIVGDGD